MLLTLAIILVLVTSFFCSLSEASLLSVSRVRIHTLAAKSRTAQIVERMKETLDRPIAAILILNTVANTGGAALAGREYERMFDGANMGLFTLGLTIAVLVFSELLPKTIGVRLALPVVLFVARPLQLLIQLMRPATWLVSAMTRAIGGSSSRAAAISLEDLRAMARIAASAKALGREEQMIIESASRLPRITVDQIMIHRQDIVYLSLAEDDETLLRAARQSMHSRIPLCHHDLDDIVGFVNVKDILWRLVLEPEDRKEDGLKRILGEGLREPVWVEPDLEVTRLLRTYSREHEHIALVRGPDGRTAGMVTLEDVIEELIGEVDDEYDKSPNLVERIGTGLWSFGGGTPWLDAAKRLGLQAEEGLGHELDLDGRYDMNDLAADRLRGKLRTGGVFSIGKWRFKVARMRRGKVLHVEAMLLGQTPSDAPIKNASAPS